MTVPWLFLQAVTKAEERPKASHNLKRSPAKKGRLRMRLESNAWKEHTEGTRLVTVTGPKHRQSPPSHWPSAASSGGLQGSGCLWVRRHSGAAGAQLTRSYRPHRASGATASRQGEKQRRYESGRGDRTKFKNNDNKHPSPS